MMGVIVSDLLDVRMPGSLKLENEFDRNRK